MKIEFTGKGTVKLTVTLGQFTSIWHALTVIKHDTTTYVTASNRRAIIATVNQLEDTFKREKA